MKHSLKAGVAASAFAHLLGLARPSGARAEEDDDSREDAARAEDGDEDGDDEPKDAKKAKKAKRAEDDGSDEEARAEDGDDEEDEPKDAKKAKKAKAADDDEDPDEDDPAAKATATERARWATVLGSAAAAGGRVAAACEMLANTSMSAKAVISTLSALPTGAATSGLRDRMASVRKPNVGSEGAAASPANPAADMAAKIVAAGKKRRGEV